MAKGSFAGLYTFEQVANIYNIDPSTIRKQVQSNKFLSGDIKKFGKTWIMTEQAMTYHYGAEIFIAYQQQERMKEIKELQEIKARAKFEKQQEKLKVKELKTNKENVLSMDAKADDIPEYTWGEIKVDEKNVESTFTFS